MYSFKIGQILRIILCILAATITGGENVALNGSKVAATSWMPLFKEHTDCGGVVPISTLYTTTIAYKEGQPFVDSEFCIWSLLPHSNVQSMRVQVTLETDNWSSGTVAYFWDGVNFTSLKLNNTDSTFDPPPAFLAFTSHATTTTTGIRILMTPSGRDIGSLKGRAFHFDELEGQFSYPEKGSSLNEYRNRDRISIVLPTRTFIDMRDMKEIKVTANDLEVGHDYVSVYSLHYNFDPLYLRLLARLSGNEEARLVTEYGHPTVILFASDEKIPGHGFSVQWGAFSTKQEL